MVSIVQRALEWQLMALAKTLSISPSLLLRRLASLCTHAYILSSYTYTLPHTCTHLTDTQTHAQSSVRFIYSSQEGESIREESSQKTRLACESTWSVFSQFASAGDIEEVTSGRFDAQLSDALRLYRLSLLRAFTDGLEFQETHNSLDVVESEQQTIKTVYRAASSISSILCLNLKKNTNRCLFKTI